MSITNKKYTDLLVEPYQQLKTLTSYKNIMSDTINYGKPHFIGLNKWIDKTWSSILTDINSLDSNFDSSNLGVTYCLYYPIRTDSDKPCIPRAKDYTGKSLDGKYNEIVDNNTLYNNPNYVPNPNYNFSDVIYDIRNRTDFNKIFKLDLACQPTLSQHFYLKRKSRLNTTAEAEELELLQAMSPVERAAALAAMPPEQAAVLLIETLSRTQGLATLEAMSPGDREAIVAAMSPEVRDAILANMRLL